jgi:hypothetical protein
MKAGARLVQEVAPRAADLEQRRLRARRVAAELREDGIGLALGIAEARRQPSFQMPFVGQIGAEARRVELIVEVVRHPAAIDRPRKAQPAIRAAHDAGDAVLACHQRLARATAVRTGQRHGIFEHALQEILGAHDQRLQRRGANCPGAGAGAVASWSLR